MFDSKFSPVVIVPGWRDSGPGHWQSLWAEQLPHAVRVRQDNWVHPARQAWIDRVGETILAQSAPVIVVAHSLGCIATVHLPPAVCSHIRAALLVAPADPERKAQLADFAPVPCQALPYPSVVVGSSNDPYCPSRLARAYARAWGSRFERVEGGGHINVAAGFGPWPFGLELLAQLEAETGSPASALEPLAVQPVALTESFHRRLIPDRAAAPVLLNASAA